MYVKFISNLEIQEAPQNYKGIINYNLDIERLIQDGYKVLIPVVIPEHINRLFHIEYVENIDNIEEIIVYEETQEEADERELESAKENKKQEALNKAYDFEQNGSVEYKNCVFEMSLSNRQNLKDTEEALTELGEQSTYWNDKNDEIIELTVEDIKYIRLNLILARVQILWINQYPYYKNLIDEATTVDEVEDIEIDYNSNDGYPEES